MVDIVGMKTRTNCIGRRRDRNDGVEDASKCDTGTRQWQQQSWRRCFYREDQCWRNGSLPGEERCGGWAREQIGREPLLDELHHVDWCT